MENRWPQVDETPPPTLPTREIPRPYRQWLPRKGGGDSEGTTSPTLPTREIPRPYRQWLPAAGRENRGPQVDETPPPTLPPQGGGDSRGAPSPTPPRRDTH